MHLFARYSCVTSQYRPTSLKHKNVALILKSNGFSHTSDAAEAQQRHHADGRAVGRADAKASRDMKQNGCSEVFLIEALI